MNEREAVVDRFEGDTAVLILSDTQEILNVSRLVLPKNTREGHYLKLELHEGEVVRAVIDKNATKRAKQRINEKLRRLRSGQHLNSSENDT